MKTKLIILRGNSGSGKSTVARELRLRMGYGAALIEQDYIRRTLLRERDEPNQPNIELIALNARFALEHGSHVIIEGILPEKHYGEMLKSLITDHTGDSHIYYFDVSLEETLNRHKTKPNAHEFGEKEMRSWFAPRDVLGAQNEQIIPEESSLEASITRILQDISI